MSVTAAPLPVKTDNCEDIEIVISPTNENVKNVEQDDVCVQEVGDGIVIHFKNVPESAADLLANEKSECSETDSSTDSSYGSDLFKSFHRLHMNVGSCIDRNKTAIRMFLTGAGCALALGYFVWALIISILHGCQSPVSLVCLAGAILVFTGTWFIKSHFREKIEKCMDGLGVMFHGKTLKVFQLVVLLVAIGGVVAIVAATVWRSPSNLISLGGLAFFLVLLWLFSAHPIKVKWRPVIGGLFLQFYFAVIILKWDLGYQFFSWLGEKVQTFLSFTDYGSEFVFGPKFMDHIFAMKVLPVVVFFSCVINVLYYVGAMQFIIRKIGFVLCKVLRTTAPESLCAAANIFVGLSEAPIVIRPFMPLMTRSELNAVMTGGFATIAGGVMAAYISFGVAPEHLLCASVMNAPCALAVAKLLYPETETSQIRKVSSINLDESWPEQSSERAIIVTLAFLYSTISTPTMIYRKERNILEAAAAGASASIKLVANIAANLIAFLAMLAFVNALISWLGSFVCHPDLTFQIICSYLFMPVAYLMGVEWKDAGVVGELIGIKTFLNEFVAYKELAKYIDNRVGCSGQLISIRSEIIATYALCGFANLGSIGIQLGGLGPMAPTRKGDLAQVVLRSLLGGIVTCLMTASVAGLLLVDAPSDPCVSLMNTTTVANSSVTMATNISATIPELTLENNITYFLNSTASVFS